MSKCSNCGMLTCPLTHAEARAEWEESMDPRSCPLDPTPETVARDAEMREKSRLLAIKVVAEMRRTKVAGIEGGEA